MGLSAYAGAYVSSAISQNESARFGFITERITVRNPNGVDSESIKAIADELQHHISRSQARVIILRYPANLVSLLRSIDLEGRFVYPGGSLLYWEAPLTVGALEDEAVSELGIDERDSQLGRVQAVLRDSFLNYVNHYATNPLIESGVAATGYAEWAHSSLKDPSNRLFVVSDQNEIVGVAVVAARNALWEIQLAGISRGFQGRGLYLRLMRQIINAAAQSSASQLIISTQSHNIAVQRAWAKLGFRPISSIETVHLVDETFILPA